MSVSVVIPVLTFAVLAVLLWVVHKTKTGMAMRAVSTDLDAARLQAIDVNRIISFTFGAGSLLAAVGGIMWSYKYPQLNPLMGVMPGLKCFIAAVIGGIGSIPGAVLGGFLLGGIELLTLAFLPTLTGYRDAFAFVLLIVVLLVKPSGLLGGEAGREGLSMKIAAHARLLARRGRGLRRVPRRRRRHVRRLRPPRARPLRHLRRARALAEPRERVHRPLLARPRRLHGSRRLHLRAAHHDARAEGDELLPRAHRAVAGEPLGPVRARARRRRARRGRCSGSSSAAPVLRLRDDYLAIATLGFAEIIRVILTNTQCDHERRPRAQGLPKFAAHRGGVGAAPALSVAFMVLLVALRATAGRSRRCATTRSPPAPWA